MSKKVRLFATQRVTRKAKNGKDALQIIVEPDTLVFDTDENGLVNNSELSGKYAEIRCYRGNTDVTDLCRFFFEDGDNINCNASVLVNRVSFTKINTQTIEGNEVSCSNGYVNITIKDESLNSHSVQIKFSVNITKFIGGQISNNKKFESKYAKLTAGMSEGSSIIQTAQNISLEVSSRNAGRRNMLKNSSFRKQEDVCITYQARIEKNTGIDGINCIRCVDTYSGSGDGNYLGAFWESTQNPSIYRNINIISGKDYIISCWIKSSNANVTFCIETFEMKSISASERGDAHRKDFKVKAVNTWERVEFVIKASELKSDTQYLAVNFWCNNKNAGSGVLTDSYICKPMMEEGDTYRGWTLSEDDYDYVGGNILDNTRSLEKSGNLEKEESEIINEGYEYAYAVSHSNNTTSVDIEMLQWNVGGRINDGQDYMLSFLAKGTGLVTTHLWKDGIPRFFVEGSNGKYNGTSSDGFIEFDLTNEWKRYWVHYHLTTSSGHPLPEKLLIRCKSGNDVYICQPKLEVGATMTEFTERKTDLVDKASLKKAGIEITTDQVKLYGDKVQVLTRKDGETNYEQAGMFSNGKLNANLIDAETIVVNGLQANGIQGNTIDAKNATISNLKVKNVIVSGSLQSPFLKVSDSFDSNYSDNAVMQVENDGWPVVYSIPWNVEQAGRKICILSNLWGGKQITGGSVSISVPEAAKNAGCRFYENGIAKTKLHFSTEVLELIAYGNISAKKENEPKTHYLYGWIVLNRIDLMTVRKFGKEKKVLAYGKVTGTTSGASIQYNTFDGSEMSVSRISTGKYKIHIDAEWVTSADKLFVILTNLSRFTSRGVSLMDIEKATTGFDIRVLTSAMQNNADGDFNFEISNFDDFAI